MNLWWWKINLAIVNWFWDLKLQSFNQWLLTINCWKRKSFLGTECNFQWPAGFLKKFDIRDLLWVPQSIELSLKLEGVTQFYINKSMHTQRTYFGYMFSLLLSLYISKTLRDFQTWIKTRPHLSCAGLGHVTVGIKQKTLKLDRTFVFLSWNILLCINIIISQAPLTLVMYLLRWSSLQYWMFNWKCHIDIWNIFLEWT